MFIDRFVGLLPKNTLKKALAHFNRGDYRRACAEFEAYAAKRSVDQNGQEQEMVRMYMVEAYIGYAKELATAHKYPEAAEQLEKAITVEPGYADVHYSLACLYDEMGKIERVEEKLRTAIGINPNFFKARVMLAKNHSMTGCNEKAVEELSDFLQVAPAFYIEQVKELIRLLRKDSDPEKRESIFHHILEERPSSSQVSKQLSMNHDYPDLHNLLGIAYANKGMTDDAVIEFETALKIHPKYLKAHLNIALTLYEKGANEKAMNHLEKVLTLDPENELARNLLNELQPVVNKR